MWRTLYPLKSGYFPLCGRVADIMLVKIWIFSIMWGVWRTLCSLKSGYGGQICQKAVNMGVKSPISSEQLAILSPYSVV